MRHLLLAVGISAVVCATACTPGAKPAVVDNPAELSHLTACPDRQPDLETTALWAEPASGQVPDDFRPTEVIWCNVRLPSGEASMEERAVLTVVERRGPAGSFLEDLASATSSDLPQPSSTVCPGVLPPEPYVLVTDGATTYRPALPQDQCHVVISPVTELLDRHPWTATSERTYQLPTPGD